MTTAFFIFLTYARVSDHLVAVAGAGPSADFHGTSGAGSGAASCSHFKSNGCADPGVVARAEVPAVARVRAGQQRRRWPCQQQLRSVADAGAAPAAPGADLRATPMPTAGLHLAPFRHQRLRRSADGRTADWRGTTCVDGRATSYASIWVCIGSNPSYTNIWM